MSANIEPKIAAATAELTASRRDIHAHPELGFEEERTSAIVAKKLKEWGLEVTTGIGKTGVVGTIRVGNNPRAIGLRADMDALPMDEHNTFDHRSQHKGRMHACGHDGHTTMLLGAAKYLSATRNFDGTVHLIFQPAEEGRGGADNVIPQEAVQRGTSRAVRKETMALIKERSETISKGIAKTLGGMAEPDVRIAFPPLVNDKGSVKFIADVAETIVGKENMNREGPYVMASEDFSYMLEKVPGAFINIGNGGGEGGCEVHNPGYDFNDEIITLGATLWSRVVETKLAKDAR